jgi:predicted RNase H-like HicB family nuclease
MTTTPSEYLKRPYGRIVMPEPDGSFRAEIIEFPGCLATGDTASEALSSLERVAESWLEATIARKQPIPEPMEGSSFSGKLVVRLGRDLHRRAAHMAAYEGVSLNQLIVSSVAEHVGMLNTYSIGYMQPAYVHKELMFHGGGPAVWRSAPAGMGGYVEAATQAATVRLPLKDEAHA